MMAQPLLVITTLMPGLMAGLFFAWSSSVMPGLARLSDAEFVSSMQSMNHAIQNPLFFNCFFGAALLLPISSYVYHASGRVFGFLLAATLVYWIGVMGVTIFGNVPLNQRLEAFGLTTTTPDECKALRDSFEKPWNRLNYVRTLASATTLLLTILALG